MWKSICVISIGASLGALLRWWLGTRLNGLLPTIPPGTLAANLVGAYVVGVAVAVFASYPGIPPEWRLFIITGFCGGLTTFSTFSAETATLLLRRDWFWSAAIISLHLLGSVALTLLGVFAVRALLAARLAA